MLHDMFSSTTAGTAILLTAMLAPDARAQTPRTQSQTSAVQRLTHDTTTRQTASGRIRDLRCRGKPGIDMKVYQESSPRTPKLVTMVLRYDRPRETRSVGQEGMGTVDHGMSLQLVPGSCTWRYADSRGIPIEPGVVYFDIPRDAQAGSARDTTIDVAMNFADVVSLTRYLSDSTRYWGFYVDDVTNVSISFGPRGRPAPPITFGAALRDTTAGATTRAGAHARTDSATIRSATGRGSTTVRAPTATGKVTAQKPTSVTRPGGGPVSTASPDRKEPPLPDSRTPGDRNAATATVVRAPLQLRGVSTVLGGFTISFSARANVLPTVLYSSEKPVRDRQTGQWVFPGGRPAYGPQEVGGATGKPVVIPGSPAVVAGAQADVVRRSTDAFRAQYTATTRPGTVGRGIVYHYIITVPATSEFSDEQYVGQLTTVSQTVRMTITSFTVLKTSFYARELKHDFVAWTDVGRGGPFEPCQSATCQNTGDYLRLLVFATPPQTSGSVFTTPGWNTQGSILMGIARQEFDLRTIPDDRPLRAFTLRSQSGEIEFEVQGTLEVVRR